MARHTKIGRFRVVEPSPRKGRWSPVHGLVFVGLLAAFAAPIAIHSAGLADLRMSVPSPTTSSPNVIRVSERLAEKASAARARSIPICSGRVRVTCIVDGDTGWHEGQKWRLVASSGGVDAPEVGKPECAAERAAGDRATRRLQALMSNGYTLSGDSNDRYGRLLAVVTLADGRDAGNVLLEEGLAQPWPNRGNPWCGR